LEDSVEWHHPFADVESIHSNVHNLNRLNKSACISRYAETTAGLASILLVSENITMSDNMSSDPTNPRSSLLRNFTTIEGAGSDWALNNDWMCSAWAPPGRRSSVACTANFLELHADTWTLFVLKGDGVKVDYCLPMGDVRPMEDKCALRLSSVIFAIVTALNLFKCICIAYTAHLHRQISRALESSQPAGEIDQGTFTAQKDSIP